MLLAEIILLQILSHLGRSPFNRPPKGASSLTESGCSLSVDGKELVPFGGIDLPGGRKVLVRSLASEAYVRCEGLYISPAGPANKQGRIVADVVAGLNSHYKGSLGSSVIKVFDLTVANAGLSEKAASAAGYQCESVVLSPDYRFFTAVTKKRRASNNVMSCGMER